MNKYIPSGKVLAGGLYSLAAFGIVMALNAGGVQVSADLVMAVLALVVPILLNYVPARARDQIDKLDAAVKAAAAKDAVVKDAAAQVSVAKVTALKYAAMTDPAAVVPPHPETVSEGELK